MDSRKYIKTMRQVLSYTDFETIDKIIDTLLKAKAQGKWVYVMGNGGSAHTASHIAGDLNKTNGFKAVSLADSLYLVTAWANDTNYDNIFQPQLETLAQKGDVVIVISGSGQSPNVVNALKIAKHIGCTTIGLTGSYGESYGGRVKEYADISIVVPSLNMEMIEDTHLMLGHIIVTEIKNRQ